jgi:peroxiredoxin
MGSDMLSPDQVFASNADIWILKGDSPWLVGLRPDLKAFMSEAEAEMGSPMGNMTMTIEYSKWAATKPESGYKVPIKETWRQVDNLMDTVMEMGAAQMGETGIDAAEADMPMLQAEATHPTVGMKAPDFELMTLREGSKVTLSSLKGKVVVLDFWATWCAPCVAGLPTVDKVTSEFKDKGVVFYAVDLQENAEKVKTFIDKKAWTFPVLLDGKGETARDYRVSGIPHSVIIGTDGIIKNVHIGFGGAKALEAQLREELAAALEASEKD